MPEVNSDPALSLPLSGKPVQRKETDARSPITSNFGGSTNGMSHQVSYYKIISKHRQERENVS